MEEGDKCQFKYARYLELLTTHFKGLQILSAAFGGVFNFVLFCNVCVCVSNLIQKRKRKPIKKESRAYCIWNDFIHGDAVTLVRRGGPTWAMSYARSILPCSVPQNYKYDLIIQASLMNDGLFYYFKRFTLIAKNWISNATQCIQAAQVWSKFIRSFL